MAKTISGAIYDPNRDMYFANQPLSSREQYEKELYYRRQTEELRRMQNSYYADAPVRQQLLPGDAPKPDPKDQLSFLSKTDTKILLTGKAT